MTALIISLSIWWLLLGGLLAILITRKSGPLSIWEKLAWFTLWPLMLARNTVPLQFVRVIDALIAFMWILAIASVFTN